jgi:hypothetical protein
MNNKIVDIYSFNDFEDSDFNEALSDLKEFGVNDDELNLNFINLED